MTAQTRSTNKNRFEQGDTPQGSDFSDLVDSFLSLADTTAQTVISQVTFSGGANIATVSGADGYFDNLHSVSATRVDATNVSAAVLVANEAFFVAASAKTFVCTSAKVITGLGVGTAAPSSGIFVVSSAAGGAVKIDTATTLAATGGAGGAVPVSAVAFMEITVNGVVRRIALFNP